MNLEKYTQKSQEAITIASQEAIKNDNQQVEEIHLHLALLESNGLIPKLLGLMNKNVENIIDAIKIEIDKLKAIKFLFINIPP